MVGGRTRAEGEYALREMAGEGADRLESYKVHVGMGYGNGHSWNWAGAAAPEDARRGGDGMHGPAARDHSGDFGDPCTTHVLVHGCTPSTCLV